jgi:hypothetical protein
MATGDVPVAVADDVGSKSTEPGSASSASQPLGGDRLASDQIDLLFLVVASARRTAREKGQAVVSQAVVTTRLVKTV